MSRTFRIAAVVGAVLLLAYGLLFILGESPVEAYAEEDGIVETSGALGLLATSVLFLLILIRGRRDGSYGAIKRLVLLGLLPLFFFGAGEEISWGQRLFGVDTPADLREANAQDELNVHNLDAGRTAYGAGGDRIA